MGIPSYFSYIIQNYTNIIRKRVECQSIQYLMMDCNSIVYDAYRELEEKYKKEPFDISTIETSIVQKTIQKIVEYIELISPEKCVYITFDGVAPFAKMNQQRIRRYKTQFSTNLDSKPIWNTTAITPGTAFMTLLSSSIYSFFTPKKKSAKTFQNKNPAMNVMVSCSDKPGEGEHKLFHHIRQTDCKEDIIAVYGLDADLIMLSIFHQQFSKNIYVFREAPTFRTVLSCEYEKKELLFMDIDKLSNSIFQEMGKYNLHEKSVRVSDYIFMCFLLGNDFLPHFPALNIRIHGIQILMDTYYQTIGKYRERSFIHATTKKIDWTNVSLFLTELSKNEHTYLVKEYDMRKKWDKYHWGSTTPLEIENLFMNLPVIYRADEKYICPQEKGWECRYYKRLLHTSSSSPDIKDICINYLEGLEWVYSYYTGECPDWKWKYNWSYPPLLSDLVKYIPKKKQYTKTPIDQTPLDSIIQLAYVLPFHQLHLLPSHLREILINQYSHLYPTEYSFKWAFCRYFWEAHPVLPEIPLSLLKEIGVN